MSKAGYIQVHAYTSIARIPLENTALSIGNPDGTVIALRVTDRSGMLPEPLEITVPELSAGQSPGTGVIPYREVTLYARHPGYQEIVIRGLQVFPDTVTVQNLPMIPLSEMPESFNQWEDFQTVPQNL